MNGNLEPELVVLFPYSNTVEVHLNTGDANYVKSVSLPIKSPFHVALDDVNDDGHVDIILTGANLEFALGISFNTGDGMFSEQAVYKTSGSVQTLATGDIDGNGQPDIVFTTKQGIEILLSDCSEA